MVEGEELKKELNGAWRAIGEAYIQQRDDDDEDDEVFWQIKEYRKHLQFDSFLSEYDHVLCRMESLFTNPFLSLQKNSNRLM